MSVVLEEAFEELGTELDRESFEWLNDNHPTICDKVTALVQKGATVAQVRAYVIRRAGINRYEFARRCENAARHLGAK